MAMAGKMGIPIYFVAGYLTLLVILNPVYGADHDPSSNLDWTLKEELEKLSVAHGIVIKGLEKASTVPARSTQGTLREQLQTLLADFNHVLIQAPDKGIERVIILRPKEAIPPMPEQIVLATERSGNHHVIRATVVVSSSMGVEVSLLVDTGASLVVLPSSIIPDLGLGAEEFEDRKVQTANGLVRAKVGRLRTIRIGTAVVRNVDAAFIDDSLLGRDGLLGMNVLGRYLMTIDDQRNLITLIKQR